MKPALSVLCVVVLGMSVGAQTPDLLRETPMPQNLARGSEIASVELSRPLSLPILCDTDGKIYARGYQFPSPQLAPVFRLSSKGDKEAEYAVGQLKDIAAEEVFDFVVLPDGEVAQVVGTSTSELYLVRFGRDGRVASHSKITSVLMPYRLAVFSDSSVLLSGTTIPASDGKAEAWSGVFDVNGKLLRKFDLKTKATEKLDPQTMAIDDFGTFVEVRGKLLWIEKTIDPVVRSVAPDGSTTKLFTIPSPERDMKAQTAKWANGRLYTQFLSFQKDGSFKKALYTASDVATGDTVAVYQLPADIGAAFACVDNEGFTFINAKSGRLNLTKVPLR